MAWKKVQPELTGAGRGRGLYLRWCRQGLRGQAACGSVEAPAVCRRRQGLWTFGAGAGRVYMVTQVVLLLRCGCSLQEQQGAPGRVQEVQAGLMGIKQTVDLS